MKMIYILVITGVVCAAIMFTGCAKIPVEEIRAAKTACETARAEQAHFYAVEQFNNAQELLSVTLADILVQQNTKSVFARNYDKNRKSLVDAATTFDSSRITATACKDALRKEMTELLDTIKIATGKSKKLALILVRKKNREAAALKLHLEAAIAVLPSDLGAVSDSSLVTTYDIIKNTLASVESVNKSLEKLATVKTTPVKVAQKAVHHLPGKTVKTAKRPFLKRIKSK